MRRLVFFAAMTGSALAPLPAAAQAQEGEPELALEQQVSGLRAEVARLSALVAELQQQQNPQAAPPASAEAPITASPASPEPSPAPAATQIEWNGAPELSAPGGWSFKPRGRLQMDAGLVDAPSSVSAGNSLGFGSEFRRAFIGVDGTVPGGFGYRAEVDIASSSVEVTDLYFTYQPASGMTLTLGHQKTFNGLDEMTSDLFSSFMERAAFNSAFGFERRVGLSGTYSGNDVLVQLGAFTDNIDDLNSDANNSFSVDGRVVFMPEVAGGRLHIGGSAHLRELNDAESTVRYRARPFLHTTDTRLVDTSALGATGERNFGVELAYIQGPFHATVEGHRMSVERPGLPDPSFWGGYVEAGMLLTPGDTTAYRRGVYERIRPANPVDEGGIGAIQLNVRYDHLDLNSGDIRGGKQDMLGASLIWIPTDYVRFLLNYGHLWLKDAVISAGGDTAYQVDTFGMRAQIDF